MRPVFRAAPAAAVALAASAACADVVDMRFTGTGAGRAVSIRSSGIDGHVFAGQLMHHIDASDPHAALDGDWLTYCTDYYEYVSSSTREFKVSNLADAPDNAPMGDLKAQAIVDIYAYADGAQLDPNADNDFAAAFQIAIWEIIDDYNGSSSSLDVASGDFKAWTSSSRRGGSSLDDDIQDYLDDLFDAVGSGARVPGLYALINHRKQDQIVLVPAPPAFAGLGAAGLLAARRRRRL